MDIVLLLALATAQTQGMVTERFLTLPPHHNISHGSTCAHSITLALRHESSPLKAEAEAGILRLRNLARC